MVEIPEARVLAEQMEESLSGRAVRRVAAGETEHKFTWFFGERGAYGDLLTGARVTGAEAQGGNVELHLGDRRVLFQDGAAPRLWGPGDRLPKKHQLWLEFEHDAVLTVTVRMYGGIGAYRAGENDNPYYLVAKEKFNPLTDAFDEAYFLGLTRFDGYGKISAKGFLATEQRIPGLGNGVLQDILLRCGVHPRRKMGTVSEEQLGEMYRAVKAVLWEMTLAGGRDTERDLFGVPGKYHAVLGKNTVGGPCPACGSTIERENFLGGSIYFCPVCQPL